MIDLHIHSNYSDGWYDPAEVVRLAGDVSAIALCDHDCIGGLAAAKRQAQKSNIDFIPGVELTVSVQKYHGLVKELHMLGLFIHQTDHLQGIHARAKEIQNAYSCSLAKAMRKYCALLVYMTDMCKKFRGAIGAGAFGAHMVQKRMVEKFADYQNICKQLIAEGRIIKPDFGISTEEAIEAIHEAGGLAILAHPYRTNLSDQPLFEEIKNMKKKGLDGLEVYYTNYGPGTMDKIKKTLQMAQVLDLLVSGGSDYHQDRTGGRFQGYAGVPDSVLVALKEAHQARL